MRFDKEQPFDQADPFNPQNSVEGSLIRAGGKNYGALEIEHVNGESARQERIHATPKLEYPFDKNGKYVFPSAMRIESYKKYDGTNIFMFRYFNSGVYRFTSYKTRMTPFLREPFLSMWHDILDKYPQIPGLFLANPHLNGFSFEMYGSQNPHLIKYDVGLQTALLFGIMDAGTVVCPKYINTLDIPVAELVETIDSDYVFHYEAAKKELSENLDVVTDNDDEPILFTGDEGHIWYLLEKSTRQWRMFKCKPDEVLTIHWGNSGIPRSIIQATAINGLENADRLTVDMVIDLLLEEFPEEQVNLSRERIRKSVAVINDDLKFETAVAEELGTVDMDMDPPEIMRTLAKTGKFHKKDMRRLFSKVVKLRGGKNE